MSPATASVRSAAELADLDALTHASPQDDGTVVLVVRRPAPGEREVLDEGVLDPEVGLVGDTWDVRPSSSTPDGSPHPDKQVTLVNDRVLTFLAGEDVDRRALAGDQLHVDLDLSVANLPVGSRLAVGTAVVELTDAPHKGCKKYAARFGVEALRRVASPAGRADRLRGANAKVVVGGTVRPGDAVRRLTA